jgi:hypothetical protein
VAEIAALTARSEMRERTIGVISLIGAEQVIRADVPAGEQPVFPGERRRQAESGTGRRSRTDASTTRAAMARPPAPWRATLRWRAWAGALAPDQNGAGPRHARPHLAWMRAAAVSNLAVTSASSGVLSTDGGPYRWHRSRASGRARASRC